jgi:hypothetical protein
MVGPLGVLPASPTAATNVVEGTIDGAESVDDKPPWVVPPWGAHLPPGPPGRGPDPICFACT